MYRLERWYQAQPTAPTRKIPRAMPAPTRMSFEVSLAGWSPLAAARLSRMAWSMGVGSTGGGSASGAAGAGGGAALAAAAAAASRAAGSGGGGGGAAVVPVVGGAAALPGGAALAARSLPLPWPPAALGAVDGLVGWG